MGDVATNSHEQPCSSKHKGKSLNQDMSSNATCLISSIDDSYNLLMFRNRNTMPNSAGSEARPVGEHRARYAVDNSDRQPATGNRNHMLKKESAVTSKNIINQHKNQTQVANSSQKAENKVGDFYVPSSVPMPRTISQPPLRRHTAGSSIRTNSQPPRPEGTLDQIRRRKREIEDAKLLVRERMWINIVNTDSKRRRILLRRSQNRMRLYEG